MCRTFWYRLAASALGWSESGSAAIQDHSDHDGSKESIKPLWSWIRWFLWRTTYYHSQLTATPRNFPHKILTSKLWRFRWQRECIQWKQSARRLDLALRRRILARLCFPLLSIILCFFCIATTSNMEFQVKVEHVKDKWITFVVLSLLVSAA